MVSVPGAAGRLPGNLDQAIFRIAALAFCSLSSLALLSDYIGSDLPANYMQDWAITGLAFAGAAASWYLARRRAPVMLILPLALLGIVLISLEESFTGGTHSHLYVLYVVPVIFTHSKEDRNIIHGYKLGANSFLVKRHDFDEFMKGIQALGVYWLVMNRPPLNGSD